MPIYLDLPSTSSSIDEVNVINIQELSINNDENHIQELSINNDEKRTSLEPQRNETSVSKSWTDNLPHPSLIKYYNVDCLCHSKQVYCKHLSKTCMSVKSTNPVLNNEQSKYSSTQSMASSLKTNTREPPNKQTTHSNHGLNSEASEASLKFSIKLPLKQLHKFHIDLEQISCETTDNLQHSSQAIPWHGSTSTNSTSTLNDNASLKSSDLVKCSSHSRPFDRNILHLKSSVRLTKHRLKTRKEIKNVVVQTERFVTENLDSAGCQDIYRDLSMQATSGLDRSNTHCQWIESKVIQTKSDSKELQQGNQCCVCPIQFESSNSQIESSSSTNMPLNVQCVKHQSHGQLNQKGNRVKKETQDISINVETPKTATTYYQNHAVWPLSVPKMSIYARNTGNEATDIQSVNSSSTIMTNDTCNSLCDCVRFFDNSTWSDSHEHKSTCDFCVNTDWSETDESEEGYPKHNLSTDDDLNKPVPSKFSNPCQIYPSCSQSGCKCLLWVDDSIEESRHDCDARRSSNHCQLSQESNFSGACKFAQRVHRGEPETKHNIYDHSNILPSITSLKRNKEWKTDSLKKVRSQGTNTPYATNNKHNFGERAIDRQTKVLQSKPDNKILNLKHSSLEQQLKSKLRYGTEPEEIIDNSSIFDNVFDNVREQILLSKKDELLFKKTCISMLSTTSSTDILTESTPVTSVTPTSSKSSVNPYEIHTTSNTSCALNLEQNSGTNLPKTNSNLINTTYLNPCVSHWQNNSVTSLCNLSDLDVLNEMEHQHHARHCLKDHIFFSEIPLIVTTKNSSSIACNATSLSDNGENSKNIIHSNNESLSYPGFSNINSQKLKTNADCNLPEGFLLANSLVLQGADHRAMNNARYNSNSKPSTDIFCNNTSFSKQQGTCMSKPHVMPVKKVAHSSIAGVTNNIPVKVTRPKTCLKHSSEKYSDKCSQLLSENMAYNTKTSKQIHVIYKKQCTNYTEAVREHPDASSHTPQITKKKVQFTQGYMLPSEHISQIHTSSTSDSEDLLQIYKNSKWDSKSNKQLKIHKPNWEEFVNTVNKLQTICNDHTVSTEQSKSSACSTSRNDSDENNSSEARSILAAQACVEILQKQLGIRGLHDTQE